MSATLAFDAFGPEFDRDPFPMLRALREQSPLYFWETTQAWLLSDYDDCIAVMRDNERFSVDFQEWELAPPAEDTAFQRLQTYSLFGLAPADHARVRKLVAPIFSNAAMRQRRPEIRRIIDGFLDEIGPADTFDVMSRLAELIPIRIMTHILDIPREQEAIFKKFATLIVRGATPALKPDEHAQLNAQMPEGMDMLRHLLEERRGSKKDDVLSELVRAQEGSDRLSTEEMLALVAQLISAGSTSTINLIGYSVLNLLRHPDQLALLKAKPELLENAIWEVLRYDQFARFGLPRYAREDVEIRGTRIRKKQMLLPLVIGVLRDPNKFPDPDKFDITRDQRLNIALGHGAHYCLGAPLARIEGEEATAALLERYPNMTLAGEPVFEPHPMIRYLKTLNINTNR